MGKVHPYFMVLLSSKSGRVGRGSEEADAARGLSGPRSAGDE